MDLVPYEPVDSVYDESIHKRRLCLASFGGCALLCALGSAACLAWRTVETSSKLESELQEQAATRGKGAPSVGSASWPSPGGQTSSEHGDFDCSDPLPRSTLAMGHVALGAPWSHERLSYCCRQYTVGCGVLQECEANVSACFGGETTTQESGEDDGDGEDVAAPTPTPTLRGAGGALIVPTMPPTPAPTPAPRNDSLFCFTLFIPNTYEEGMIDKQLAGGVGVFECEAYAIYSNVSHTFGEGNERSVDVRVVDVNLQCEYGEVHMDNGISFTTAFNTPIFIVLWKKVFSDGTFLDHNWTVKVDPDTVFLPDRLRAMVRSESHAAASTGAGMFLNNCKLGLHGPIEVLSSHALSAWAKSHKTCPDPPEEDVYLQKCLTHLGSEQMNQFDLLAESSCHRDDWWQNPYWEDCTTGEASFHPFKNVMDWQACHERARSSRDTMVVVQEGDELLGRKGRLAELELPPEAAFAEPGMVPPDVAPFMGTKPVPTPEPTPPAPTEPTVENEWAPPEEPWAPPPEPPPPEPPPPPPPPPEPQPPPAATV